MDSTIRSNSHRRAASLDLAIIRRDEFKLATHISIDMDNEYFTMIRKRWGFALARSLQRSARPEPVALRLQRPRLIRPEVLDSKASNVLLRLEQSALRARRRGIVRLSQLADGTTTTMNGVTPRLSNAMRFPPRGGGSSCGADRGQYRAQWPRAPGGKYSATVNTAFRAGPGHRR